MDYEVFAVVEVDLEFMAMVEEDLERIRRSQSKPEINTKYYKQWIKVDYMVSSWIMNSISKELGNSFSHYDTTKKLWNALCKRFDRRNGPKIVGVNYR